jgi:hypothetical protein
MTPDFAPLGITSALVADLINTDHNTRPRSQQQTIGPSGIGAPCARQIGHTLRNTPRQAAGDMLPAWIGTEAHAGMARILEHHPDWWPETPITIDDPELGTITGTADAYHLPTRCVVDWKFTSTAQITKYKANGPGPQYRTQAHLYGLGLSIAGTPVERVAIVFIPRSGLTSGIHVWEEPHNPDLAGQALDRLAAIRTITLALGPAHLPTSPEANCDWCPYHQPGTTDLDTGCPGHQ